MTLLQLNYLAEIAECGSINKAAKKLFISQSGMSNTLRELEAELGISIFERNNKGVAFTEAGQRLFEQILPILEREKWIKDQYSGKNGVTPEKLYISAQHYPFAAKAFTRLIDCMKDSRYILQFKETHLNLVIEDVASGLSEIGILFLSNATEQFLGRILESRDLEFFLLLRVAPHVFMRKGHPLAGREQISIEELSPYPYMSFMLESAVSCNFSEEMVLNDFTPSNSIVRINDRATAYNVMAHSDAFSIGSGMLSQGFCDPNLTAVPLCAPNDEIRLGWIRQKNRALSEAAKQYIWLLTESIREEDD